MSTTTMTGAALRCTREYLGVSASWLARQLGVQERTVRRWEQGGEGPGRTIPEDAASLVWALEQAQNALVQRYVRMLVSDQLQAPQLFAFRNDAALPSVGDYPASWYRMAAARALRVAQADTATGVVYFQD